MSNNDINVVINEVRAAHKPIDKEVHHGDAPGFEYKRCATTVVNLGNQYTVIKHKDAEAICGPEWKMSSVRVVLDRIEDHNMLRGQREYLVIESDWPEYESVKQALLARINGDIKSEPTIYADKTNADTLQVNNKEELLDTYWNALSEAQKRKALRGIMVALPVQQDHCPSDNLAVLYPHYHKDVSHLQTVDVYRVLELFGVTEHTIGHAIKKLLCAGVRGAKDREKDVREAVDTLNRHLQMKAEDCNGN